MKGRMLEVLAIALMLLASHVTAAADSRDSLAGTWSLDDRSSDDPVEEIGGKHGNGLGRQIVKSVNVFGIPVGSLPLPGDDEENKEDPLTPAQIVGASLAYVFEATYRLRITQNASATEIRYGNAPANIYRDGGMFEHDGWTSKVEWRNGALTIEHERPADGAHISERYWIEPRADELRWTATLKRPKKATVEVERVFYRAPANQDANLPFTARLSP
ncbi:MAG TPA: hypothetical protein VFL84_13995 [Gammaproteobacteria bacterium]|nr:hypothetical protein [Gammaproteobacteria bacterium]